MIKNIGIIGQGFVGGSITKFFKDKTPTHTFDLNGNCNCKSLKDLVNKSELIFVCLPTPMYEDGSCDLSIIKNTIKEIEEIESNKIIVIKSTVPVGTNKKVVKMLGDSINGLEFEVVSNPEFLREGSAIEDFMRPDRVIVGTNTEPAKKTMAEIYRPLSLREFPIMFTDPESAEMIKYSSNAFLATKISFINEVANLCEKVGADVKEVAKGMGLDKRIGDKFLNAGPGYGGSCFPKDVQSLSDLSMTHLQSFDLLQSIITTNQKQQLMPYFYLSEKFDNLQGLKVCVLGLSFKAGTDDIRESSSINLINQLSNSGAIINTYDPVSINNSKKVLPETVNFFDDPFDAINGVQATIIMTEWSEFQNLDWKKVYKSMKNPKIIFDGKNYLNQKLIQDLGFEYFAVGRKIKSQK